VHFYDEFILYTQTLINGLNYQSDRKYFLEHALPNKEDQGGMTGLVLQEGQSLFDSYVQVKSTGKGNFRFEFHISFEDMVFQSNNKVEAFAMKAQNGFDQPAFNRYFTMHSDPSSKHHFIRFEMPLRQLRSRNLLSYSIFIFNLAQPFIEAANALRKSRSQVAA
jgi:hypothetical protein